MERQSETGAIRLTNKTAISLRRCARRERTLALCAATVLTLALAVIAVLLGIRWLPAVPIVTALTVLLDAAIYVRGYSRYLSLTGQAICAEAAARQLRAGKKEKSKRTQAQRDLEGVRADAARALEEAQEELRKEREKSGESAVINVSFDSASKKGEPEEKPLEEAKDSAADKEQEAEQSTQRRRRRQSVQPTQPAQPSLSVLRAQDAK